MHTKPSHCHAHPKKWFLDPLFLVCVAGFIMLLGTSFLFPGTMLWHHFIVYTRLIWWAILLGILMGGIIDYFIPSTYIEHLLSRPKKRTILYAVMLGFLMSACSHGILAIAIQLYKKGASIPSVITFLLASPWANLPLTFLLVGFFGVRAVLVIGFAIIIALITGFIFQFLESKGYLETQSRATPPFDASFSIVADIKKRFQNSHLSVKGTVCSIQGVLSGMWSLSKMVLWWILIGMMIASVARAFVPQEFIVHYLGPTTMGLIYTLLLATVIEVCSEGSAPLAFELYYQTKAFGGVFVFLMAGVVTDYTEIGLLWRNVGLRTALFLPLITVPQVMLIGFLLN